MSALKIFNVMIMISIAIGCWVLSKVPSRGRKLVLGWITNYVPNFPGPSPLVLSHTTPIELNQMINSFLSHSFEHLLLAPMYV